MSDPLASDDMLALRNKIATAFRVPPDLIDPHPRPLLSTVAHEQERQEFLKSLSVRMNAWAEQFNQRVIERLVEEERRKFYEVWTQEGVELADLINRLQHYDF